MSQECCTEQERVGGCLFAIIYDGLEKVEAA